MTNFLFHTLKRQIVYQNFYFKNVANYRYGMVRILDLFRGRIRIRNKPFWVNNTAYDSTPYVSELGYQDKK
jgi:hypothetical protein